MKLARTWHINITKRLQVIFRWELGMPMIWRYPRDRAWGKPIIRALYLGFIEIRYFRKFDKEERDRLCLNS